MRRLTLLVIAIGTVAGVIALKAKAFRDGVQESRPSLVTEKPEGYREWKFISVAHEQGNVPSKNKRA
ncbi:MAG TPA: hypothetical protein VIX17_10630 [Pyrinomonadaceae bacterium]|jgi:hypothetical protein